MTETLGAAAAAEVIAGDPHREGDDGHPEVCANCETALQGAYCHACGQRGHLHNRLRDLLHEALEGIIHFDGRLWRTLPLLALSPGRLSREWREGRRARYVQPLHLFLFAVFLFFTLASVTGQHLIDLPTADQIRPAGMPEMSVTDLSGEPVAGGSEGAAVSVDESTEVGRRLAEVLRERLQDSEYYSYKIETLAYKLSFLLAPISMGILALLMLFRRGYSFYDHGVVSLYGIGSGVLAVSGYNLWAYALSLAGWEFTGLAVVALMLALTVHVVVHLRGAYALSWPGAVARGLLLSLLTMTAFGLFLLAIVAANLFF